MSKEYWVWQTGYDPDLDPVNIAKALERKVARMHEDVQRREEEQKRREQAKMDYERKLSEVPERVRRMLDELKDLEQRALALADTGGKP